MKKNRLSQKVRGSINTKSVEDPREDLCFQTLTLAKKVQIYLKVRPKSYFFSSQAKREGH